MKKLFIATLLFVSFFSLSALVNDNKDRLLTVIYTNDGHGMAWSFDEPENPKIGGLAAQKTLVDRIRAEVQGNVYHIVDHFLTVAYGQQTVIYYRLSLFKYLVVHLLPLRIY